MLVKDKGICIYAIDYSETSQIVTFFTRANGKIRVIAKGSKRTKSAFGGPVETLSEGEIVFTDTEGEKLATLTEFEQRYALSHLTDNLFCLNCCLFATELVSALTHEYDPHPGLFDYFLQFLQDIDKQAAKGSRRQEALSLLVLFQISLLREIGLQPVLDACINCKSKYGGTWSQTYFSHSANGLICRDCEASFPDRIKLSKIAADALNNPRLLPAAQEKTLNEIEKVLIYHFRDLIGRPPKMAKHILKT